MTNPAATRDQILAAASHLIAQNGVENTSLADIARQLGISRGTLFYHFPSKSQLIFEVTDRYFSQVTQVLVARVLESSDHTQPHDLLRIAYETLLGEQERGRLHMYLVQQALAGDPSLLARFQARYREWLEVIQRTVLQVIESRDQAIDATDEPIRKADIGQEHARLLAFLLLGTFDGLLIQRLLGIEDIPIAAISSFLLYSERQPE